MIHSLSDRLITRPPIIVFHFHLQRWQFTAIHFMTLLRCVNTCAARSSSIFLNIIFDPLYCSTFLAIVVHFKSIIVSRLFYHIDLIHFSASLKLKIVKREGLQFHSLLESNYIADPLEINFFHTQHDTSRNELNFK